MHSPVRLNGMRLVGILVGGGALKWHTLVLILGAMLRHMRLDRVGWVLVLHRGQNNVRGTTVITRQSEQHPGHNSWLEVGTANEHVEACCMQGR